jgi:hypothetical protein
VSPGRYASCKRLLRGILLLDERNQFELVKHSIKRHRLLFELQRLTVLIGDKSYADARLLLPLSRRVGAVSTELKICEDDLLQAQRRTLKFRRSKNILLERLRLHQVSQSEEDLENLTSSWLAQRSFGKSATRKCH